MEEEEDFFVECSDEELYNPSNVVPSTWQPTPEKIKELYFKLSRGEKLELEWKSPGKRLPFEPPTTDIEKVEEPVKMEEKIDEAVDSKKERNSAIVSDFEFEDLDQLNHPVTNRRTPAQNKNTPKPKKQVAQLDKIMNDFIQKKVPRRNSGLKSPSRFSGGRGGAMTPSRGGATASTPPRGGASGKITSRTQLIEALAARPTINRGLLDEKTDSEKNTAFDFDS